MRPILAVLAAIAVTVVADGPAAAQDARQAPSTDVISRLRLKADQAIGNSTRTYIVQMAAKPAVSFEGGTAGFAKTAPAMGERYDARSSHVQMYATHIAAQQDSLLASVGAKNGKIYSYVHSLNGFAARMTAAQAAKVSKNRMVLRVWEDKIVPLATNNSANFLKLRDPAKGLRARHGLRGRGVTIGVVDTGAVQEHPSYDDTGLTAPADWNGTCQAGEGWDADDCNNKLIGARYFVDGFGEPNVEPRDFISARDSDGHGTHTSTTAAGRGVTASLAGVPLSHATGMAPSAYLAIYKACWVSIG
jgi:subtilisin family serine protease